MAEAVLRWNVCVRKRRTFNGGFAFGFPDVWTQLLLVTQVGSLAALFFSFFTSSLEVFRITSVLTDHSPVEPHY